MHRLAFESGLRSDRSPNLGFKSLSARATLSNEGIVGLLSHYDIVADAVDRMDDEALTRQCNIMQQKLASKATKGIKVHTAKFETSSRFKRGMNLPKWTEERFIEVGQHEGIWEIHLLLHEKLALHRDLQLQPPKSIMDQARARVNPEDADDSVYKAYLAAGEIQDEAIIAAKKLQRKIQDRPSTWEVHDEVEVLTEIDDELEEKKSVWVRGNMFFYKYDKEERRVVVVMADEDKLAKIPQAEVRLYLNGEAMFETPEQQAEAGEDDETVSDYSDAPSRNGHKDIGLIESGVFIPGKHQPWMAIFIVMRLSKAAQILNQILAPQLLKLIDDQVLREECQQRGNGRFIDTLVIMFENEGQSPGLTMIQELNKSDLTYKSPKQLCLALSLRDQALEYADKDIIKVWELLKVLDTAISSERDADWKQTLRDAREMGLKQFTSRPAEAREIMREVRKFLQQQLGVRAALSAIRSGDTGSGRSGSVNQTRENVPATPKPSEPTRHRKGGGRGGGKGGSQAPVPAKKGCCYDYGFYGECNRDNCPFASTHNSADAKAFRDSFGSQAKLQEAKRAHTKLKADRKKAREAAAAKGGRAAHNTETNSEGSKTYVLPGSSKVSQLKALKQTSGKVNMHVAIAQNQTKPVQGLFQRLSACMSALWRMMTGNTADQSQSEMDEAAELLEASQDTPVRVRQLCHCGVAVRVFQATSVEVRPENVGRFFGRCHAWPHGCNTFVWLTNDTPPETVDMAALMAAPARIATSPGGRIYSAPPQSRDQPLMAVPVRDSHAALRGGRGGTGQHTAGSVEAALAISADPLVSRLAEPYRSFLEDIRFRLNQAVFRGSRQAQDEIEAELTDWLQQNWRIDGVIDAVISVRNSLFGAQDTIEPMWALQNAIIAGGYRQRVTRYEESTAGTRRRNNSVRSQPVRDNASSRQHRAQQRPTPTSARQERGRSPQPVRLRGGAGSTSRAQATLIERIMSNDPELQRINCIHHRCVRKVPLEDHFQVAMESPTNRTVAMLCGPCRFADPQVEKHSCRNCDNGPPEHIDEGMERPPETSRRRTSAPKTYASRDQLHSGASRSGRVNVNFRVDSTSAGSAMNAGASDLPAIEYQTEEGGKLVFTTQGRKEPLARVHIGDDIIAEVLDKSIDEEEALIQIAEAVPKVDKGLAAQVAKHLKAVQRQAAESHKWRLSTSQTHTALARVMCAVRDVLVGMCHLGSEYKSGPIKIRYMVDSCCDTHLVAREVITELGLWDKVDKSKIIKMGTAGPDSFETEGMVQVPIRIKAHKSKTWHTLCLEMHIADMKDKCLISQQDLKRNGWKTIDELNKSGEHGSFMIAPDGVMFALHLDEHNFPILHTEGAPIKVYSRPDEVRVSLALAAFQADSDSEDVPPPLGYDSEDVPPSLGYAYGYDSNSESEDEGLAFALVNDYIENKAAKAVGDETFKLKDGKGAVSRTRPVVHTPESWHALMHCGRLLSEATAVGSDAKFNIGGKIKLGKDLNVDDLEKLEIARKACTVCKQTKLKAPAARKGEAKQAAREDFNTHIETGEQQTEQVGYIIPALE